MLSIIVPVYNALPFLGECLSSIASQIDDRYEVLLVDDGSTDGSARICDEFAESRPNVSVVHGSNRGQLAARRQGVEMAKGDYLLFLDADDCLREDAVATLNSAIEETQADIICYGFCRGKTSSYDSNAFSIQGFYPGLYHGADYRIVYWAACTGYFNSMANKVFRAGLLELACVNDVGRLGFGEDLYECLGAIDRASSLLYLDRVLYFYRENPDSCTHSFNAAQIGDLDIVFKRLKSLALRWGPECVAEARRTICRTSMSLLSSIVLSGGRREDLSAHADGVRCLLERHCENAPHAVASLRIDHALPLGMLVRGDSDGALRAVRFFQGLYALKRRLIRNRGC